MFLKSFLIICSIFTLLAVSLYAQTIEKFELKKSEFKVANSLYNKMAFLDVRPDTSNLGFVQVGAFNKRATVIAAEPFDVQFNKLLAAMIDSTAKPQELLFQLKKFSFSEITGAFSENGYLRLNASLYKKNDTFYQLLGSLDADIETSAIDVTVGLLKKGNETISKFIAENLTKEPISTINYSYDDIFKVDSIGKSRVKLYTTTTYADGAYLTYQSFSSQTPDAQIIVDGDSIQKNNVKMTVNASKPKKVKADNSYAIVYKGQPYVVTPDGFIGLEKIKNDFVFTGKMGGQSPNLFLTGVGAQYGLIGGAITGLIIAGTTEKAGTYNIKIDYTNGKFISFKEVNGSSK